MLKDGKAINLEQGNFITLTPVRFRPSPLVAVPGSAARWSLLGARRLSTSDGEFVLERGTHTRA